MPAADKDERRGRSWRRIEHLEEAGRLREADPQAFAALSPEIKIHLGYYEADKAAAKRADKAAAKRAGRNVSAPKGAR